MPRPADLYFEHREVIPGVVPHRVGHTCMIWHPPATTRRFLCSFGVSPYTTLDACFLWWDKVMLNQYQWWTFVSALIVENRIPSTRQSLALSAVDRYCGVIAATTRKKFGRPWTILTLTWILNVYFAFNPSQILTVWCSTC